MNKIVQKEVDKSIQQDFEMIKMILLVKSEL